MIICTFFPVPKPKLSTWMWTFSERKAASKISCFEPILKQKHIYDFATRAIPECIVTSSGMRNISYKYTLRFKSLG